MEKRIEIRENWRRRIIGTESVNHFLASSFEGKLLFEIGTQQLVHQFQVSTKGWNESKVREQSEQFTDDIENFLCNKTEANKMIIEIGEFKELISKSYADVLIVLCGGTEPTYKFDDESIKVSGSCTTTHFNVKIYDIDNLDDGEVVEKAKEKLFSAIGDKNEFVDDTYVERTPATYNVSRIRISYE